MKKAHIAALAIVALMATSCTQTHYILTRQGYDRASQHIAMALEKDGYRLTEQHSDRVNEPVVTTGRYSEETGFTNQIDNNFVTYESYTFSNSHHDQVTYGVKYSERRARNGDITLNSMQLTECKVTNPDDFGRYCGNHSSIQRELEAARIPVKKINELSRALIGGGAIVVVVLLVAIAMVE